MWHSGLSDENLTCESATLSPTIQLVSFFFYWKADLQKWDRSLICCFTPQMTRLVGAHVQTLIQPPANRPRKAEDDPKVLVHVSYVGDLGGIQVCWFGPSLSLAVAATWATNLWIDVKAHPVSLSAFQIGNLIFFKRLQKPS